MASRTENAPSEKRRTNVTCIQHLQDIEYYTVLFHIYVGLRTFPKLGSIQRSWRRSYVAGLHFGGLYKPSFNNLFAVKKLLSAMKKKTAAVSVSPNTY